MSSAAAGSNSEGVSQRGADEAEEEGAPAGRRAPRKNRVRINRDQEDIPMVRRLLLRYVQVLTYAFQVRDETGEKVTELFQHFLEQ